MIIFLDTMLLWTIANPNAGSVGRDLRNVIIKRLQTGDTIAVAEICNYETRRELLRKKATRQLANLDNFIAANRYVPLNTGAMHLAADLWAQLRSTGKATTSDHALDGDVILGAQAQLEGANHVVATENLKHLSLVCNAVSWKAL